MSANREDAEAGRSGPSPEIARERSGPDGENLAGADTDVFAQAGWTHPPVGVTPGGSGDCTAGGTTFFRAHAHGGPRDRLGRAEQAPPSRWQAGGEEMARRLNTARLRPVWEDGRSTQGVPCGVRTVMFWFGSHA
ncbi:hypothetical protein GCM10010384_65140 [Streptomyces djakartensis]|uniref:Uncharacterized protein n=1 Tax=Streptomyces djakartensis TaxID=68193 RepID=A0ABQ3AEM7_9ACTN|nr:hypothetical protein GCM10010384_65140 [Streptomyces djakartensis]